MDWKQTRIIDLTLDNSWTEFYIGQTKLSYFETLNNFIEDEKEKYLDNLNIFPPPNQIYSCLNNTHLDQVKVVILGQDPYHQKDQAMGLSFSVPKDIKIPPSLVNIYKELKNEFNIKIPDHGDLTSWSNQGVLLLNTALTVREHCANSHSKFWQPFTNNLIKYLSDQGNIIFILWGNHAKEKKKFIDLTNNNFILTATHPSPLSCNRGGFFGCNNFKDCNEILKKMGKTEINWNSVNES
jgi:uracil-DNA glycosylase